MAFTTGELILFLDDDACAHPDCVERLSGCFEDAQVVGAGALIEPLWPKRAAALVSRRIPLDGRMHLSRACAGADPKSSRRRDVHSSRSI